MLLLNSSLGNPHFCHVAFNPLTITRIRKRFLRINEFDNNACDGVDKGDRRICEEIFMHFLFLKALSSPHIPLGILTEGRLEDIF